MPTLREVGDSNWTNKAEHGYLEIYEELWKDIRNKPINFLEIGVYNGNSMRTWCEWFPKAIIIGIEKDPSNPMKTGRAVIHFGDQADTTFLEEVSSKYDGFDIIMDDGGHIWWEQQISFETLWPHVKSGGMYIIEDLHTSADPFWGKEDSRDTVEFLYSPYIRDLLLGFKSDIKAIYLYPKLAVLYKK